MMSVYTGWLPYGSNDSSVVFADPLTSLTGLTAAVAAAGGTLAEEGTAASAFDSELGMLPGGPGGGGAEGYSFGSLTSHATLSDQGQISFEVETKALAVLDTDNGTSGADTTTYGDFACISFGQANKGNYVGFGVDGGNPAAKYPVIFNKANTTVGDHIRKYGNWQTSGNGGAYIWTPAHDRFTTVNICWRRSGTMYQITYALDGCVYAYRIPTSVIGTELFEEIWIGSLVSSGNWTNSHGYMRNLQISTRYPSFYIKRNLSRTVLFSDSLFDTTGAFSPTTNWGDAATVATYIREISKKVNGLQAGYTTADVNGGYSFLGGSAFSSVVSNVTDENPRTVIFEGGVNDVSSLPVAATWIAEYKSVLSTMYDAGVENVVVCTITDCAYNSTYDATDRAKLIELNTQIQTLPAWAAANYPEKTLYVCDLFSVLNEANDFIGGYAGTGDNLHWHAQGHVKAGAAIADTIYTYLFT